MNRYAGAKCPHCGKTFTEDDTVAVCPECGAPYHRSCFEEMGGVCRFVDKHAEGFNWNEEEKKEREAEQKRYEGPGTRCSRCGTQNDSQNLFCSVCGTLLHRPEGTDQPGEGEPQQNGNPYMGGAGPFRTMGYNPYTTPYGGLSPDEEIDGIPVKELAIYLGENSHYYLPRFKDLKTNGRNVINWSGFLLEFLFLVYRKMYLAAVLVFLIPNLIGAVLLLAVTGGDIAGLTVESYQMFSMLTYAVSIAVRFFVGISFNRLYMNHCFKKIRALRSRQSDQTAYYESLAKSGSVSRAAVAIVCGIYIFLMMAVFYLSIWLTPMV